MNAGAFSTRENGDAQCCKASYLFPESVFLLGVGRQKMGLGGFDEELGLGNLSIMWATSQTLDSIAS